MQSRTEGKTVKIQLQSISQWKEYNY